MALTGEQFTIASSGTEATIVEVGAGLRRLAVDGTVVAGSYGEDEMPPRACGASLVPWPNRLRGGKYTFDGATYQLPVTEIATGNANHGLARWTRWSAVEHTDDRVTMACDIVPQTGWPFELRVAVTYTVSANGLHVAVEAGNDGRQPLPFGCGFHPYLSVRGHALDDVSITVPAAEHLVVDDAQIPVGTEQVTDVLDRRPLGSRRLDDAFTGLDRGEDGRARVEVRTPSGGAALWLGEAFGYTQIYTPDDLAHGVPAIAVEPMSCPADAFNSGDGLVVLRPGGQWHGEWGITPLS